MPRPVPDKNLALSYKLRFGDNEAEYAAALEALKLYPTFKDDCLEKREKKEKLRMDYMKLLLKKKAV